MTKLNYWLLRSRWFKVVAPGAVLFQISGCLSDAQLTQILTGVVTTGLSSLLSAALEGLVATGATTP